MEATKSRLVSFCLTNKASGRAKGESHESVAWFSKGRANLLSHRKTMPFSLSLSPMATETQSAPAAPELTILNRVASIPLVNDTFTAMHSSLISNPLTRSPYTTAQAISLSALRASEPIAAKLAPIIVRADGFANKGLDAVESRYPYPFTVQSEEILKALKDRSEYARDVANKTIDERVRTPAYSAVQGIDQVSTPLSPVILTQQRFAHFLPY